MADILIKGLSVSDLKRGESIIINQQGTVYINSPNEFVYKGTAIELRSHGRLVDKDAILDAYNKELYYWQESPRTAHDELVHIVNNAPTIVEASK